MTIRIRILLTLLAMSGCAQLATAQTDAERIKTLEARVDSLTRVIGRGWFQPQQPCASLNNNRPEELPNGEYNLAFRNRQFGCAFNPVVEEQLGQRAQIAGLASRVGAVESRSGLGRTVRADSLILGTCIYTRHSSQLAICGQGDANIHVESNLSSTQYQSPRPHVGMWSMSGDGGLRIIQNAYLTLDCYENVDPTNGVRYQDCLKRFVDPQREVGIFGPDSRANFSWSRTSVCQLSDDERVRYGVPSWVTPIPCPRKDYTQDVVLVIDPDIRKVSMESWQSNWVWEFVRSSCRTCRDIPIPIQ